MGDQRITGATVHDREERAEAVRPWREGLATETARRISGAFASGAAALRSVDARIDDLARRDWSVAGMANRVRAARRDARARLVRERDVVMQRLDHAPVTAVAYVLERSKGVVEAIAGRLERGATSVAPKPAEPRAAGKPPPRVVSG